MAYVVKQARSRSGRHAMSIMSAIAAVPVAKRKPTLKTILGPVRSARVQRLATAYERRGMRSSRALASALGDTAPSGVACSADGTYVWDASVGAWTRIRAGQVCATLSGGPTVNTPGSGGGVTVVDTVCMAQPAQQAGLTDLSWLPLAPEGEPIVYKWACTNATELGLTRDQRSGVAALLAAASASLGGKFGVSANANIDTIVGKVADSVVNGKTPLMRFKVGDEEKRLRVTMSGDLVKNPTLTFVWDHDPSLFQAIDDFVKKVSPWDPAPLLCQMIPMASKVPNPYVAAGSVVLQLSGKCDGTCPPPMLYDEATKTCSCPPGTMYDGNLKTCVPGTGPGTTGDILPLAIAGVAVLTAIWIFTSPPKKKAHP